MSQHPLTPSPETPTLPRSSRRRISRAIPLATLLAGALVLAGCGGDDDDSQEPPATPAAAASFNVASELASSIPADADVFAEVKLNPEGDQKAALDELVGLFGDDAEKSLVDELGLDEETNGRSMREDLFPYLGERAGGFAIVDPNAAKTKTTKDDDGEGAIVAQVKDRAKVLEAFEATNEKSTKKVKIAGQDGFRSEDGAFLWVGDDLAVMGTEKAVAAAIEAQGGETLDKNERFTNALKQVRGSDPFALGWADMQNAEALGNALTAMDDESSKAVDQLKRSGVPGADASSLAALEQFSSAPLPNVDATIAMAVLPKPGEIKIEIGGTQPKPANGSNPDFAKAGADAVAALPSGSWLAFGGSMQAGNSLPGYSFEEQLKEIEKAAGTKLPAGLTSTLEKIKTAAVGIKGDSMLSIGGAAIVQTTDAAAATEMLTSIERELAKDRTLTIEKTPIPGADASIVVRMPQLPVRIAAGVKGDRLVVGLGAESVSSALEGAKTLSADPAYTQAKEALGGDAPTLLVNPAPLAQLIGDLPVGGSDAQEMTEVVNGLKAIKLIASSSAAPDETNYRGTFVLRYDAALLGQVIQGNGGGSAGGSGTVTGAKPGR